MTNTGSGSHDEAYERLVRQEELILEVTERLTEALLEKGVTKTELARRLGRTPGFVSQVFGGGRNLTLRTISDVAAALSLRPVLELAADREPVSDPVRVTEFNTRRWTPLRTESGVANSRNVGFPTHAPSRSSRALAA